MVHYGQPPKELEPGSDYYHFRCDDIWYDSIIDIYDIDPYKVSETKYGKKWKRNDNYQIPQELKKALLDIRKEIVDSLDKDWMPGYFVKYAQIYFIYKDQMYIIYPKTMGLDGLKYSDEYFGNKHYFIIDKLKEVLGVEREYYDSFLD